MNRVEVDRRMTADRQEIKYLLSADDARSLAERADRELVRHSYSGRGANSLPGADHYVTTVYFDTENRDMYRQSLADESSTKVRAREYYDDHPDLVELATDPEQLIRYNPVVWLEIKHRDRQKTRKRRVGLPKRDIPSFFGRGEITPEMVDLIERDHGAAAHEVLRELEALFQRFDQPLQAQCLVNYRRAAWQGPTGGLRLTIDDSLAVFRPPRDLWTRSTPLTRASLGERCHRFTARILEVKSRASWPPWLRTFLAGHSSAELPGCPGVRFGKFLLASTVIHR